MIAQVVLFCIVSLAAGAPYVVPGYPSPAAEPVYETKPEPYAFGFDTKDEYGTSLNRKEEGDELGNKRGSYGYVDAYGIYRQVDYVADDKGFRAVVKTNEPGTESQNPADTEVLSEAVPVKYDAPVAYAKAPVASAYVRPASVVAPAYAKPAVSVAPAAPLAPVAPVAPAAPLAPLATGAPLTPRYVKPAPEVYAPAPSVYASAPVAYAHAPAAYAHAPAAYAHSPAAYAHAPAAYAHAPAAYAHAPVAYAHAPAAYAHAPAAYAHAASAYAPAPVYEPVAPQSYAGPSYEQLVDKASQPTESRKAYE